MSSTWGIKRLRYCGLCLGRGKPCCVSGSASTQIVDQTTTSPPTAYFQTFMYFHVYQIYALFHRNNASFSSFSLYIARSYSSRRLVCTSRQALVQIQKIKTAGYSLHIVGNSKGVPARAGLLEYTAAFWYSFISVWDSCDGTIWYSAHIVYIVSTLLAFCIISHCNIWN